MNNCIISGNLGQDVEVFFTTGGDPVASFSLAFKGSKKKTSWVKCVCFNKTAEIAEKYLHSGAKVLILGMLNQNKWKTEDGENRSSFEILVNSIEFIKIRNQEDSNDETPF